MKSCDWLVIFCICLGINIKVFAEKPEEYKTPLYFPPQKNQIKMSPFELDYDLLNGETLRIGPVEIRTNSLLAIPYSATDGLNPGVRFLKRQGSLLILSFPVVLFNEGRVLVVSEKGQVVWAQNFDSQDIAAWSKQTLRAQEDKSRETSEDSKNDKDLQLLENSQLGIFDFDLKTIQKDVGGAASAFRFCIEKSNDFGMRQMLCSQRLVISSGLASESGLAEPHLEALKEKIIPRVLIQQKEAPLKAIKSVQPGELVSFFAQSASGFTFEFLSEPEAADILDLVESEQNKYEVIGVEPLPFGEVSIIKQGDSSELLKLIGWQHTIGDLRTYWRAEFSGKDITLYFPGKMGGIFGLPLKFDNMPKQSQRVFISEKNPKSTYSESYLIHGWKPSGLQLSTMAATADAPADQSVIVVNPENPEEFTWNFLAADKATYNKGLLPITASNQEKWIGAFEVYRAYPIEVSGRFTAISTKAGLTTLAEFSANWWFETLAGLDHYRFSNKRWGLSFKSFRTLGDIKIQIHKSSNTVSAPLSSTTFDLKYRLTPGVWGRDESRGMIMGYQSVTFNNSEAPMLGVGGFWARSMPKVVDDFLNRFAFLKQRKFIDIEFIYYPVSLSSNIEPETNFLLHFNGKIFWTERFFGEAGLGVKSYAFLDQKEKINPSFNFFYTTLGLGFNF